MRLAIDDLPFLSVSRLRASGEIAAGAEAIAVRFPGSDLSFTVALSLCRFPNGGSWSFFLCRCGRRVRTLRLYNGDPACKRCLEARGFRYRVEDMSKAERAAYVAPRLRARLNSEAHARVKPHLLWSKLERRKRLEAALRRCEYTVSRHDFQDLIGDASFEGSGRL
jgi:hypothetical protein